jgi:hypothetical protein
MEFNMTELFGQDENGHLHIHIDCYYRPSELKGIMKRKATALLTKRRVNEYSNLLRIKILDYVDITKDNSVQVRCATGAYRPLEYDIAFRVAVANEPLIQGTMLVSKRYEDIDLSLDIIKNMQMFMALRRVFNRVMMTGCDRENVPF